MRKPLTMEGKPSLTIEITILLYNEIPCYRRNSLTIEANPLVYKEMPHYYRNNRGTSYSKGFLDVVTSLIVGGSPLLYSKGFPSTVCLEISRRGFPYIARGFLI